MINSMQHYCFAEATSYSRSQEIPPPPPLPLMKHEGSLPVTQNPATGLYLISYKIIHYLQISGETAVAQCLRCCATNRKVAGSIPASVIGVFIDVKSFRSNYGPGVDPASNINEFQEYFLGVKAAGA